MLLSFKSSLPLYCNIGPISIVKLFLTILACIKKATWAVINLYSIISEEVADGNALEETPKLFSDNCKIAITGGDFSVRINEKPVELSTILQVKKGSILSFGKRNYGVRTYIAIQGGIRMKSILGSKSFYKGITHKERLEEGTDKKLLHALQKWLLLQQQLFKIFLG